MTKSTELRALAGSDLDRLNKELERLTPQQMVRWAHGVFGKKLCVLSAFQQAGCMLCHVIADLGLQDDVDVVFVDTGVNFQETIDLVDRIEREYGLNIIRLHPEKTMAEQTADEGVLYLSPEGQKRCCFLRKRVPLQQIKGKYEGMLGSLRRSSGGRRSLIPAVSLDADLNLLRIHPLLTVSNEQMEEYLKRYSVPTNPLHEQGFPTISCNRCTTPVLPGEDQRAGRWRHLEHAPKYCSINPTDRDADGHNETIQITSKAVEKIVDFSI